MVAQTYHPYAQEVEAGNQGAQGDPGLLSEFVVCLNSFILLGSLFIINISTVENLYITPITNHFMCYSPFPLPVPTCFHALFTAS